LSHDVFISHSSLDKLAADAVCHGLEAKGIRCWIAPRDQVAGRPYGEQITAAIEHAQVMVLVFSDHVNNSQAVLNEINIAAGSNVTIVPFRIAKVDFNSELHFYLGRMHWLDAFPQPVDAYIDALLDTIRRNLKRPPVGADAAADALGAPTAGVEAPSPPLAPPPPIPGQVATRPPEPQPRAGVHPGLIVGGALGGLFLILLIVVAWPRAPNPGAAQATNTVMQALANSIAREADDDSDAGANAARPAAAASPQPIVGDGAETTPVRPYNATAVAIYEQEVVPGGPPAILPGATVINTQQLVALLKARDAGTLSFWLIDARGCTSEPTIPTSICLNPDTIGGLETQVPDKAAQIVAFCHDGSCPMSYQLATQALADGYRDVVWYRGGINAWMAAGGPTTLRAAVTR